MSSRIARLLAVGFVASVLSGCSVANTNTAGSSSGGGNIQMAVSKTCVEGVDSSCVLINGQSVTNPSVFQNAGIQSANIVQNDGQNAIHVTFTETGSGIIYALSEDVAQAGNTGRLILKVGDEMLGAIALPQALVSNDLQIALPVSKNPQEILSLIYNQRF